MKHACRLSTGMLILVLSAGGGRAQEQETVVIPKSRLEELERKEAELERLRQEHRKAAGEKQATLNDKAESEKALRDLTGGKASESPAESGAKKTQPSAPASAISTLAPLAEGQVVEAVEVMNHYRSEPAAAAKRYQQSRLHVVGEIVGFDKPMFVRYATVAFKTSERGWRVVCRLEPPANLPNLFTAKNGDELVGSTSAGVRSALASVGQRVVIEGWCQGLKGQVLTLTGAKLLNVE